MRFASRIASLLAAIAVVVVLALPTGVGAVDFLEDVCDGPGADSAACTSREDDGYRLIGADGLIARATNILALVAGVAAVILIIVGSFQFITAAGDSGKISSARKTLTFAIVGLIVIVVARTIVVFVVSRL